MISAYFLEVEKISEDIFSVLSSNNIYFSYFWADEKYYLFLYSETIQDFDFLFQKIDVIKQLNFRRRQIRSARGFILFALEIKNKSKEFKVIETNLSKFFWENVQRIINQNKKKGLEEFLIGKKSESELKPDYEIKIKNLTEKIEVLEDRLLTLEKLEKLEKKVNPFKNLREIPEKELIEIIEYGFERQEKDKISLRKYYEGEILFQWKNYNIKYETIRRNSLFQKTKNSKNSLSPL
jgi:hypothetical protein